MRGGVAALDAASALPGSTGGAAFIPIPVTCRVEPGRPDPAPRGPDAGNPTKATTQPVPNRAVAAAIQELE